VKFGPIPGSLGRVKADGLNLPLVPAKAGI
jgi:hypothetical protein